jgi:hypothetical protein
MTDEQINVAIAEACGWTQIEQHPPDDTLYGQHPSCTDEVNKYYEYPIPNYCNDLNAMHEAEEMITGVIWRDYFERLQRYGKASGIRATARQRAEAFLRTLGKWEETAK